MPKILYVGIDAHLKSNTVAFLDNEGNRVIPCFSLTNNLPEAEELEKRIIACLKEQGFDGVKIATEATALLDSHLIDFLASSPRLAPYLPEVYQLNPKLTKAFKKAYPDKDKTDVIDAQVIADRLRFGHLPKGYQSHQPYLPLRRLCRYRYHLVEAISREKDTFLGYLFLKYSSFRSIKPFSNTFGKTSLSVISDFFSPDELASTSLEELVSFAIEKGKNRFVDPEQIAQTLQRVGRESYRIRPALASSVNLILGSILVTIRALEKSLAEIDKAIAREFAAFPNTLKSIKGIGPVYAAGIFSEIGDIKRFKSQIQLAKFAGLTWRKRKSGNFEAEETRMTKTGNKYLRYYLIEAANSLRRHNQEYKTFYEKKYIEVPKHQHKRALALSRKEISQIGHSFSLQRTNCINLK